MSNKYYDTTTSNTASNMPHTASPGADIPLNAAGEPILLVDSPAEHVVRLTLNRPEKRNSLNPATTIQPLTTSYRQPSPTQNHQ